MKLEEQLLYSEEDIKLGRVKNWNDFVREYKPTIETLLNKNAMKKIRRGEKERLAGKSTNIDEVMRKSKGR